MMGCAVCVVDGSPCLRSLPRPSLQHLHPSPEEGGYEAATLLLERGADVEAKDGVSYADREIHLPHTQHIPSYPILYRKTML